MSSRVDRPAFLRIMDCEISKILSAPSLVVISVVLLSIFPVLSALITYFQLAPDPSYTFSFMWPGVNVGFAFIGGLEASYLLIPCLTVLSISSDESTGFNMLQMVLAPGRLTHLAGKLCLLFCVALPISLIGGAMAVVIGNSVLWHIGQEVTTPLDETVGAIFRLALGFLLMVCISAGLGYVIRQTGIALASAVFLLMVAPLLLSLMPGLDNWSAILPSTSIERFVLPNFAADATDWHDPGRGGALMIALGWAVVLLAAGCWRYCKTDCQRPV